MAVRYPVIWRDEALRNKERIDRYLSEKWTGRELQGFYQRLEEVIQNITLMPFMFPQSASRKLYRKAVLSKHHTLFYKFDGSKIVIQSISDNRQGFSKK